MEMPRRDFIKGSLGAGAALGASSVTRRGLCRDPAIRPPRPLPRWPNRRRAGRRCSFRPSGLPPCGRELTRTRPGQGRSSLLAAGRRGGRRRAGGRGRVRWFDARRAPRMTADERYAKRLRESLLANAGREDPGGQDVLNRTPPWRILPWARRVPGQSPPWPTRQSLVSFRPRSGSRRPTGWCGWASCRSSTIGSCPSIASTPWIRWVTTGGASASRGPGVVALRRWPTNPGPRAGSLPWRRRRRASSITPAWCY